jgi:transcriptional regulator with XRE-family HTH domain
MIYDKIENTRKNRNFKKMDFYAAIGMTGTGYADMVKNNSMKIAILEKIANVLNVPVSYFFSAEEKIPDGDYDREMLLLRIELLEKNVDILNREIELRTKMYEALEQKSISSR